MSWVGSAPAVVDNDNALPCMHEEFLVWIFMGVFPLVFGIILSPFLWISLIIPFLKKEEAFTQSIGILIDLSVLRDWIKSCIIHSTMWLNVERYIYILTSKSSTNKKEKVQTHKRTMWHVQICRNLALFQCLFVVPKLLPVGYFSCKFHSILITIVQRICLLTWISRGGGWGRDCSM